MTFNPQMMVPLPIQILPECKAAPPKGQGVVAGRLSSLVIGLVAPQLVAGLTVTQVELGVFVQVAILEKRKNQPRLKKRDRT